MDSLDGLRGIAVLLVVFSHTSNANMFFAPFLDLRGVGKSGVFLFFLLSSFLLTLPLLDKGKQVFTLQVMSQYWQRRLFRIYPLYTVYLLLGVFSTWVIANFFEEYWIAIPFDLDWTGFARNLFLLEGKGINWSIVVEFKFYFILPVLVLLITLIRSYGHVATILFFFTLMVLSQVVFPQSESVVNDTRLLPYMPIFIVGMFLAVLQDHINNAKPNNTIYFLLRFLGVLGVVGVMVMTPSVFPLFGNQVKGDYFHKQFILYALFWSFVILSAVNVQGVLQRFLTLPALRFYGAISFSLYLLHLIFIRAVRLAGIDGYMSSWAVLLGSTLAAYISFKFLEAPASKYKLDRGTLVSIARITNRFVRTK